MSKQNPIRLFWWSEPLLMGKPRENYGDLLGKYLVEKISGKEVVWVHPKKWHFKDYCQSIYVTAGSVLAHVNKKCIVWGSGIIKKEQMVKPAKFIAVRGPQTQKCLLNQGYKVPEVFGDPGMLLPLYYNPSLKKKYKLGIVPHYTDFEEVLQNYQNEEDILVINLMTNDIEATTDLFLQCEKIVSSSLHGLIISHAYQIPAVWVKFSNKLFGDGIKFQDYFESVQIPFYRPDITTEKQSLEEVERLFAKYQTLPEPQTISDIQKGLLDVCPFLQSKVS